jgi:hypothetical protein
MPRFLMRFSRWMIIAWLFAATAQAAGSTSVTILLRYDDYAPASPLPLEQRLFDGLETLAVPVLVAVVPFPTTPYPAEMGSRPWIKATQLGPEKQAYLAHLLRGGRVELALHGFNQGDNQVLDGGPSEFGGLPLERQVQLLELGRHALEAEFGQAVRVFTPPYNRFDGATLDALERSGFSVLSAGLSLPARPGRLHYLPGTTYPEDLAAAVDNARRLGGGRIVVVMHPYDFVESGMSLPAFRSRRSQVSVDDFLGEVRRAQSAGVRFVSVTEALQADASARRVEANVALRNQVWRTNLLLPALLAPPNLNGVLLPTAQARWLMWKEGASLLGLLGLVGALAYGVCRAVNGQAFARRWRRIQGLITAGIAAAVTVAGVLSGFYFVKVSILVFALTWLLGVARS